MCPVIISTGHTGILTQMPSDIFRPTILVVDDDKNIRKTLKVLLVDSYEVATAESGDEACQIITEKRIDLVLLDLLMPGMDGIETLEQIKKIDKKTGIILISALDRAKKAVTALKKGAYDYITKPFDDEILLAKIKTYFSAYAPTTNDLSFMAGDIEIVTRSPKMLDVFNTLKAVASTSTTVLITGETGTGKELIARAIHFLSDRRKNPFVGINCGAIPAELMESELFGHEKGAFTGAYAKRIGKFEFADGGTVFLDEISSLPLHMQTKLLRVIQERVFERVGGNATVKINVRIIAATNQPLEKEVAKGTFREDLYYRLNVVPIYLPPLRERKEDIPLLLQHFLKKHSLNPSNQALLKAAITELPGYNWPGNIRELENLTERFVVLSFDCRKIKPFELIPKTTFIQEKAKTDGSEGLPKDLKNASRQFERKHILNALKEAHWNRASAAKSLKIHRNTLFLKLKKISE